MAIDRADLEAMARLSRSTDGERFIAWLDAELSNGVDALLNAPAESGDRDTSIGRCQAYRRILRQLASAADDLRTYQTK